MIFWGSLPLTIVPLLLYSGHPIKLGYTIITTILETRGFRERRVFCNSSLHAATAGFLRPIEAESAPHNKWGALQRKAGPLLLLAAPAGVPQKKAVFSIFNAVVTVMLLILFPPDIFITGSSFFTACVLHCMQHWWLLQIWIGCHFVANGSGFAVAAVHRSACR
jgi:hypothetical protein